MKDKQGGLEDCFDSSVANETFIVETEMKKRTKRSYLFNAIIAAKSCSFSAWLVPKYCQAYNKEGRYKLQVNIRSDNKVLTSSYELPRLPRRSLLSVHMGNFRPIDRDEIQETQLKWWN